MSVKVMTLVFESDVKPSNIKFALLALADNATDGGLCRPGVAHLAEKTGTSRSTMFRLLAILEEGKLIERRERRRPDGSRQANGYRINLELLRQRTRIVTVNEEGELERLFSEDLPQVDDMVSSWDDATTEDLFGEDGASFASSQDETGPRVADETGEGLNVETEARPADDTGMNRQENRQPDHHGTRNAPAGEPGEPPHAEGPIEERPAANDPGVGEGAFQDPFSGQEGHPDQAMESTQGRRPRAFSRVTDRFNRWSYTPAAKALVDSHLADAPPVAHEIRMALLHNVSKLQAEDMPNWAILEGIPACLAKCHPNALAGFVTTILHRRPERSTAEERLQGSESLREQMRAMDAAEESGQLGHFGLRAIGAGE